MTVDKTTAKKYADMKVTVQAQSKTELSERIKINTIADSMFVIEGASLTERILTHAEYGETLLVSGNLEFTDNKDYEEFSGKSVSFFLNGKRRDTWTEAVNAGTNTQSIALITSESITLKSGRDYIPMAVKTIVSDEPQTQEGA